MEISLDTKNYGYYLVVKADNVNIKEDIEEIKYGKDENGKTDFRNVSKDLKSSAIDELTRVLDDVIYYRKADYDSTGLIERLFEKLPVESCEVLLKKLNEEYGEI